MMPKIKTCKKCKSRRVIYELWEGENSTEGQVAWVYTCQNCGYHSVDYTEGLPEKNAIMCLHTKTTHALYYTDKGKPYTLCGRMPQSSKEIGKAKINCKVCVGKIDEEDTLENAINSISVSAVMCRWLGEGKPMARIGLPDAIKPRMQIIEVPPFEKYGAVKQKKPKARKNKVCGECLRTIFKGEYYEHTTGLLDGQWYDEFTCSDCLTIRNALFGNFFSFSNLLWDIYTAFENGNRLIPKDALEKISPRGQKMIEFLLTYTAKSASK